MADQPIPDFSQNQQFAPGFQPQQPIPGITSSYPQNQPFQPNQMAAQQADMMVMQSNTNARMTMQLTQQNLMNSMHTALMGTMGAFSDMSRRGGSMITAMSPTGKYNDMLAPNQNWALESSFRREVGFRIADSMGLDPHKSALSRFIQGRRPEFLTEGEYRSTMGFATEMRKSSVESGLLSVGATLGLGALPLTGAAAFAFPILGGMVADAAIGARFAEHEDLIAGQMYVKNRRVGIGQQFMSTNEYAKMHDVTYKADNPFAARMLDRLPGMKGVADLFRPDTTFDKTFKAASEGGLLSFENLDADHVTDYINKITKQVEKFSKIGKVTKEASMKMMSEIKGSGIQGNEMFESYKTAAYTSSLTGINMQDIVGLKTGASQQANQLGMNNFAASQGAESVLSGFAMMQQNGMFRNQNIGEMTNKAINYNYQSSQNITGKILQYGSKEAYKAYLVKLGGGSLAKGQILDENAPQFDVNIIKHQVENAKKMGYNYEKTMSIIKTIPGGNDPQVMRMFESAWYGMLDFEKGDTKAKILAYSRREGNEDWKDANTFGAKDFNDYTSIEDMRVGNTAKSSALQEYQESNNKFSFEKERKKIKDQGANNFYNNNPDSKKLLTERTAVLNNAETKMKSILGKYKVIDSKNIDDVVADLNKDFEIKNGKFTDSGLAGLVKPGEDPLQVLYGMIEGVDKNKFGAFRSAWEERTSKTSSLGLAFDKGMSTLKGLFKLSAKKEEEELLNQGYNQQQQISLSRFGKGIPKDVLQGVSQFITTLRDSKQLDTFKRSVLGVSKNASSFEDFMIGMESNIGMMGLSKPYQELINSPEKLMSLINTLNKTGLEKEMTKTEVLARFMDKAGFKTKDGKYDKEGMIAASKGLKSVMSEYDSNYSLIKNSQEDQMRVRSKWIDLFNSKDENIQKVLKAAEIPEEFRKRIMESKSGFMEPGLLNSLGMSLGAFGGPDEETINKLIATSEQEASTDPSDKVVSNLNDLLKEVLIAMKPKEETPKPVPTVATVNK